MNVAQSTRIVPKQWGLSTGLGVWHTSLPLGGTLWTALELGLSPEPKWKASARLTVESQAPSPCCRTQGLLPGSQNRPPTRGLRSPSTRPTPGPGGSEASEWGERRHFRRQWQAQPTSAREAGGAGSPGNHRRAAPRRAGPRSGKRRGPGLAASAMLHPPHGNLFLGGLSPRRPPQPERSSPSRRGS